MLARAFLGGERIEDLQKEGETGWAVSFPVQWEGDGRTLSGKQMCFCGGADAALQPNTWTEMQIAVFFCLHCQIMDEEKIFSVKPIPFFR